MLNQLEALAENARTELRQLSSGDALDAWHMFPEWAEVARLQPHGQEPGQIGALLRQEGLYSSHLTTWRQELQERDLAALAPKKRGPQTMEIDPRDQELATLRRENARLLLRAERAELLVEIQKKVSMLLGVDLPKSDAP